MVVFKHTDFHYEGQEYTAEASQLQIMKGPSEFKLDNSDDVFTVFHTEIHGGNVLYWKYSSGMKSAIIFND